MRTKLITMFATAEDYKLVLRAVEAKRPLKYILCGLFETPILTIYNSGVDIDGLGIACVGKAHAENSYMVVDITTEISVREVPQRKGGMRYAVDGACTRTPGNAPAVGSEIASLPLQVPHSVQSPVDVPPGAIFFNPGGLFTVTAEALSRLWKPPANMKERYLIEGGVGTASNDPDSVALYRTFVYQIKKRFTRIRSYWVGPEALQLMDAGMCLTQHVCSTEDYCLKRPESPSLS